MGNLQVRFLEGWAPAMAPGYSNLGITSGFPLIEAQLQEVPGPTSAGCRLSIEIAVFGEGGDAVSGAISQRLNGHGGLAATGGDEARAVA
jgi:hypothetical protein